ncbi:hypothetical protein [Undibacterium sp.]|uniref:hypothetical protein n=1 Tax=Undibacterium sp. TaxID=1914977 RepID=UPI0025DFBD02|nr:hypothetical protein [Undibacterium sp.]
MNKLFALLAPCAFILTACGGAVVDVDVVDNRPIPPQQRIEYLTHPTISGLEYFNTSTGSDLHFTTAAGRYTGYTGNDVVSFYLGNILLFTMPGELPAAYSSLYEASRYAVSSLRSATAVENLMAFLMAIDDDGNYLNGIQIADPVRVAARALRVDFNQSAYNFRADPAVQYATAVLSGNTLYGARYLPSPADAVYALQVP